MLQWFNIQAFKLAKYKWLIAVMLVHVAIAFYFITKQNITYDEPGYIEYSKRWLHGNPKRVEALDDSKTPVISIVWLPRIIRQLIHPNYQLNDYGRQDQKEGRYMMVFFSLVLIFYLYRFIQLFKLNNGICILFFLLLDPLIIAYSVLINSDLLSGVLLMAIVYHLYQLSIKRNNQQFLFACLFMGIALVTKHTFLFGLPLFFGALIFIYKEQSVIKILIAIVILLLLINIAFYFTNTGMLLNAYHFKSNLFNSLQKSFSWLPIPLPETYLQSIDLLQYHAQLNGSPTNTYTGTYLLQKVNVQTGFWYYYLVVALYKMPFALWCLFVIGLGRWILKAKNYTKQFYFIILPIVYFVLVLSLLNDFQIGVRHLLIVIPLVYVLLAFVVQNLVKSKSKWLVVVLFVWMFVSVLKYYPDLIPYTNELIVQKSKVYQKIMDSSIDYGQSDSAAVHFLQNNPTYKIPNSKPASGNYLLSMHQYIEQIKMGDTSLNWLVNKYEPIGLLKHVYLKYQVP